MAETKTTKRRPSKPASKFSAAERAAMKEAVREHKRAVAGEVDGEADVLAKIAEMAEPDRAIAQRIHAIIKAAAPELEPRTWYGMPAYGKGGKVICHFQNAGKFKMRYATLGFSDKANLDDGEMWPVAFAITELTPELEERISALVKRAVS